MTSEPRTVELSKDNFNSAIETFLRSMKEIKNDEDVVLTFFDCDKDKVKININPKEVTRSVDVRDREHQTIH